MNNENNNNVPSSPAMNQNIVQPVNAQEYAINIYPPNEQPSQGNISMPQINPSMPIQPPPTYQQTIMSTFNESNKKSDILDNQQQQQPIYIIVGPNEIPRHPTKMYCPNCKKTVNTSVQYEDNVLIWCLCIILFLFTFLCCIPFCIEDLKDVVHYCPICRREIARREKIQ
ncbi:hypothetical protein BCR36DRAFT_415519 [Piromyces finnis]|uniref:LITAF domain-containing protein n=1 Tax=Piromyces finnis TaxID=1754191 RepID=A0A1Y1UYF7_9FUNG|nr:hypothetical protein BCR36DRAFT_415519 [Piromyces finnis]|eukprot:ORX43499.1 hypothetical protein BCR36DRAFT_415519 [Piromyces finnis]